MKHSLHIVSHFYAKTLQDLKKYPTTQRPSMLQKNCTWRIVPIIENPFAIGGYFQRMRPIPIKCFPQSAKVSDQAKFDKSCKKIRSKPEDQKSMNDKVLELLCKKSGWEPSRG